MILAIDEVERIARAREGNLDEVPFAVLLYALARFERSVTLEISRPPMAKKIVIERGIPIQCQSNLAHETLSRFMQRTGKIDNATANECLAESISNSMRFGDVLLEKNLICAEELHKLLQLNLARRLLDGFSWQHGAYRLSDIPPEIDSTLRVNVPQLIIFGVTRFATQQQIDASIGPLIGTPLAIHPSPFFSLDDIRMSPRQRSVLDALAGGPLRIDELASSTGIAFDELSRMLFALTLIGGVAPVDHLPKPAHREQKSAPPPRPATVPKKKKPESKVLVTVEKRDELMRMVLNFRRMDAFELLGVDPDGFGREAQQRYLEFAERFAPWGYPPDLEADARRVFLAGARAFGELCDPDRRQALLDRREACSKPGPATPTTESFRIETDLLDPEIQFRKGRALIADRNYRSAITQLEYASDLDPQNGDYRAELAYCRYLYNPEAGGPPALDELDKALRIDPASGLAHYYRAELLRQLGRYDEAEESYRLAIKPMSPDRRPIDALKALQKQQG
jgi:hypothetical protein